MAIAVTSGSSNGNTSGATLGVRGTAVPSGAAIVVAFCDRSTSIGTQSITDDASNSYSSITSADLNGLIANGFLVAYRADNVAALTSLQFITYTKAVTGSTAEGKYFYVTGQKNPSLDSGGTNSATGSSTSPSVAGGTPGTAGKQSCALAFCCLWGTCAGRDSRTCNRMRSYDRVWSALAIGIVRWRYALQL